MNRKLGAPSGAFFGVNAVQSSFESRTSSFMTPLKPGTDGPLATACSAGCSAFAAAFSAGCTAFGAACSAGSFEHPTKPSATPATSKQYTTSLLRLMSPPCLVEWSMSLHTDRLRYSRALNTSLLPRLPVHFAHHQPESDVRHRVVGIGAAPRARPVRQAVIHVAEERAAARHALRRTRRGAAVVGIVAVGRARRVLEDLRAGLLWEVVGAIPVGDPLPRVTRHIHETVAVRRECPDG